MVLILDRNSAGVKRDRGSGMHLCSYDLTNSNCTTGNLRVRGGKGTFKDGQLRVSGISQEVSRIKNLDVDYWEVGRMFRRNSDFNGQRGGRLLVHESDDRSRRGTVSFRKAGRITENKG